MSPPSETNPASYLGVYPSVPTSTYSEIYPSEPSPQIREIASLYRELIDLFISMRYINLENVHYPPHNAPRNINLTIPARFGFTKDVVDLYQLIPHIHDHAYPNWNHGSDHGEFIMGGEFLPDLRDRPDDPERSWSTWEQNVVDPFYALHHLTWQPKGVSAKDHSKQTSSWDDESGPYIKTEYAVLSDCGNHGSVMILNTKNWHMWLIEQLGGSSDPKLRGSFAGDVYPGRKILNKNDLMQYPSRPAVEFLADIIERFKSLQWLPGGLYDTGDEYLALKQKYIAAGWPESFDASEFDRLRQEAEDAETLFRHQTSPLEQLEGLRKQHERLMQLKLKIPDLEAEIASLEAESPELALDEAEWEQTQRDLQSRRDTLKTWRRQVGPMTAEDWEKGQAQIREQLEHSKSENKLMMDRQGRLAGTTDEEHQVLMQEGHYEKEIKRHEALLADQDSESRGKRLEKEVRSEALAVDAKIRERWVNEKMKRQWKPEDWHSAWEKWFEMGVV
ncbi:hypothetical protein H2200_004538 [Cladophialophora chaetospira]|uniref:Uncharacterized protein n=1 Tax=Cladophialophora chaetospira TaxID=386627 RepID=A0AA38XDZ1_9EURO|nr:hypothetical protein H2200_004538 [Cladophialophora chaetospira]